MRQLLRVRRGALYRILWLKERGELLDLDPRHLFFDQSTGHNWCSISRENNKMLCNDSCTGGYASVCFLVMSQVGIADRNTGKPYYVSTHSSNLINPEWTSEETRMFVRRTVASHGGAVLVVHRRRENIHSKVSRRLRLRLRA